MDRVLVTGGAGFIGRRTAMALVQRGYEVRVLDRLTPPVHPKAEWPAGMRSTFECQDGDVRSKDDWLRALRGVQAVVHLAAYQDYLPDFSRFMTTNGAGTALLYELVLSEKLPIRKVVIASSQAVYGEGVHACREHGVQHPDARSISELRKGQWEIACYVCGQAMASVPTDETAVNPQNAYGISKRSQEQLAVQLGRRYEIPSVALRYSITQGSGQSFYNAYSGICRIFAICALLRKPFPVYEDGRQLRDYVYAGDVALANVMALEDSRMDYQVFNVGGHEALSVLDYARVVNRVAGTDLPLEVTGAFRVGDTRHIVSDSSKLTGLGWRQTKDVPAIVEEYLDWARAQALPERINEAAQERMRALGAVGVAG